ncbi:MAG: hypothetical protein IIC91_06415 [Chloroflexi bacterium]|nr:hypothetical protein [Chloroflexota bacterium]MCH8008483.1 hypothetical protein [Chloroflexota bacterium]
MDWKTLRREKLAKAAAFKPAERRGGVWWNALDRAGDWWYRFTSLSWWEKSMVIGTGVLLAVLTPMAAFALAGGNDNPAALVPSSPTAAIVVDAGPSATPSPRPSITPKPVPNTPTPTSIPEPIREDCDELRGANDGSPEEQFWFLNNCELEPGPEPEPDQEPEPNDPPTPVPQRPTNTPQPEPSISASQAAALAAGWIRSNPAFSELTVSTDSCIPQASGSGWRVGCTGTTNGCVGVACELTIWVCVTNSGVRQC